MIVVARAVNECVWGVGATHRQAGRGAWAGRASIAGVGMPS